MEFTLVDGAVALVVILSGVLAYSRGLTREVLAIGGWVLAAIGAALLTPLVEPLVREAPGVGSFLASSCILSVVTAFTLLMALFLLVLAVFTPLFSSLVLESVFGPVDRVLGFVFGVARGALLIAVAYLLYAELVGNPEDLPQIADARSRDIIVEIATVLSENLPSELPPWFSERIDAMMAPCGGVGAESPQQT